MAKTVIRLNEDELKGMIKNILKENIENGNLDEGFWGSLCGLASGLKGKASTAANMAGQGLRKAGQAVANTAKDVGNKVADTAKSAGQAVSKQVGDLIQTGDGQLRWIIKKTGDITHYPLKKDDDPTGSIVIWEHPMKNAPYGLYIAGIDSYDYDQSGTNSLGSCIIYKRVQSIESYSDIIVAEYTGRPNTAEEFYENVRKLLIYYNATAMYENQNKGLFVYFTSKHCEYLLADQPDIISDIVVSKSTVNRKKGCHMNKQIKAWGEGLIKDWLNEINADGTKNLYHILSEPLIEELIAYNDIVNVDRVMAMMQLMIYREQLFNVTVKEKEKANKSRLLFDGPIFAQGWGESELSDGAVVEDNVYTFSN